MTEEEIRADERRIFADYFDLRAQELAEARDQYADVKWLRAIYLDVANMIRFNQTAGGNDGYPISGGHVEIAHGDLVWGSACMSIKQRLGALISDWQANGNSRELGDPTAHVWHKCAQQLLDALREDLS